MPSLRFKGVLECVLFRLKGNPQKTHTKLSRVLLHVLRPPGVVYVQAFACAFGRLSHTKGVCAMYSHEYLKHVNSTRIHSLNEVLSFLVFTSPFDPLRSRIAPFTFHAPTYSFHHVSLHYTTHLCTFSPTTTPLPNSLSRRFAPHSTNGRIRSLIIDWLYTTLHTIVTHTSYGFRQKLIQLVPIFVEFTPQYDPLPTYFRAWGYAQPISPSFTHRFHHIHTNVHTNVHKSVFFHINSLVFYLLYITLFITL